MDTFLAKNLRLDLLVNNGGVSIVQDDVTEDGLEVHVPLCSLERTNTAILLL